ncbi:hypothetical protein MMC19_001040 [Ptychographa xylographoides]|nr:hypothetical protein [Ptychographa xylographoides]
MTAIPHDGHSAAQLHESHGPKDFMSYPEYWGHSHHVLPLGDAAVRRYMDVVNAPVISSPVPLEELLTPPGFHPRGNLEEFPISSVQWSDWDSRPPDEICHHSALWPLPTSQQLQSKIESLSAKGKLQGDLDTSRLEPASLGVTAAELPRAHATDSKNLPSQSVRAIPDSQPPSSNLAFLGSSKPDQQAAHALTELRSSHEKITGQNGILPALCPPQACTKNDCPSETQIICPAEEIEAWRCDGNCEGQLCTGTGCPYNGMFDNLQLVSAHRDVDGFDCSALWCPWPCDLETCNFDNQKLRSVHLEPQTVCIQDHRPQNDGHFQEHYVDYPLPSGGFQHSMEGSISHCAVFVGPDHGKIAPRQQFCLAQIQDSNFHWKDCQLDPTSPVHFVEQSYDNCLSPNRAESADNAHPSHSPSTSGSSVLEASEAHRALEHKCMWSTDRHMGLTCGFPCENSKQLQEHIEQKHVATQQTQTASTQDMVSSQPPKLPFCQWEGCKHSSRRKAERSRQALQQHICTHSGCTYSLEFL